MSLRSRTRVVDGVTILDLSGRVTLGEGSVALHDAVRAALGGGARQILLNLREVDFVDSSGLGELVSAYTSAKSQGGDLRLLHPAKKVHDLLMITKLHTIFDVKEDEAAAVASFGEG